MKEPDMERQSESPWPRVMRESVVRRPRSVDRGSVSQPLSLETSAWDASAQFHPSSARLSPPLARGGDGVPGVEEPGERGHLMHGNRDIQMTPPGSTGGRSGKACGLKPDMNVIGKSDIGIVPKKAANKGAAGLRSRWREGR